MAVILTLCRSVRRWELLNLAFCTIVLSCCLLPLPSDSASLQAGYAWNGDPTFANVTGPTTNKRVSTTFLASSPNYKYALALTIETSKTSNPTCYLEVYYFYGTPANVSAPAPPPGSRSSFRTYPWTRPCNRTPLPSGNCTFAFTTDGDIQLRNSVSGRSVVIWSSNTTGLGATTLDVRDYDIVNDTFSVYDGNLVLYNSTGYIVWENERNDSDHGCPASTTSQAGKRASVTSLMCLALISFGAAFVVWDSGTATRDSGRLIVGFAICCLLLAPSASESKPIQAGFTLRNRYNSSGSDWTYEIMYPLVQSPANRTVLWLHISDTQNWGSSCYLVVKAGRNGADIVLNASAPSTNGNTVEYVPWSVPCPRKLIHDYGNCTFAFTMDGDIQVLSGVGGGSYDMLWSSNTAGLGATTMDVLDSDPSGSGSVVLYNNRSEVVWKNVANMTNQDFECSTELTPYSGAALRMSFASSSLLLVLATALLLKFLPL